jgi:hypothetical protein
MYESSFLSVSYSFSCKQVGGIGGIVLAEGNGGSYETSWHSNLHCLRRARAGRCPEIDTIISGGNLHSSETMLQEDKTLTARIQHKGNSLPP